MNAVLSLGAVSLAVVAGVSFQLGDWPWAIFCVVASSALAVMSAVAPR